MKFCPPALEMPHRGIILSLGTIQIFHVWTLTSGSNDYSDIGTVSIKPHKPLKTGCLKIARFVIPLNVPAVDIPENFKSASDPIQKSEFSSIEIIRQEFRRCPNVY